jgi:hypothetical protein
MARIARHEAFSLKDVDPYRVLALIGAMASGGIVLAVILSLPKFL